MQRPKSKHSTLFCLSHPPTGDSQAPSTPDQSTEPTADEDGFIAVGKHTQQVRPDR